MFQNFLIGLLLHRDCGFIPRTLNNYTASFFNSTFKNLIGVQDGFVCVAVQIIHESRLPVRKRLFFV